MAAMTLPPVNPAPIATLLVAPPVPGAGNAATPGSFSQLLEAADARRQAEEAKPAPGAKPARNSDEEARLTARKNAAGNRPAGATAPAPKPAPREDRKTERTPGAEDSDNNTAERSLRAGDGEADADAEAATPAAGTDTAALLAGLGLAQRAPVAGDAGAVRGLGGPGGLGRQTQERAGGTRLDAALAADAASTATPGTDAGAAGSAATGGPGAARRGSTGPADAAALAAAGSNAQAAAHTADTLLQNAGLRAAAEPATGRPGEQRPLDAGALGALAGFAAAPAGPATGSSASHPAEARLGATPGQAGFAEQLGAQLSTFVREGVQHARLQLHPLELGPVTVQIQLDGGSAHLSFAAEHAQTRQALEQALPTLAGSLREAGLTLSGGGVFEQPRQAQPDGQPGRGGDGSQGRGERGAHDERAERGSNSDSDSALLRASGTAALRRRGVVDLVA